MSGLQTAQAKYLSPNFPQCPCSGNQTSPKAQVSLTVYQLGKGGWGTGDVVLIVCENCCFVVVVIYSLLLQLLPLLCVRESVSELVLRKSWAFYVFSSFLLLERSSISAKQLHCHRELPKVGSRGWENPGGA